MERLVELRDAAEEYACACIAKVYKTMGSYGPELMEMKHLFHIMSVWSILDSEVTRLKGEDE